MRHFAIDISGFGALIGSRSALVLGFFRSLVLFFLQRPHPPRPLETVRKIIDFGGLDMAKKYETLLRMSWFHKSAAVAEPPETDADKLAKASAEAIFAEQAFDLAVATLREHNSLHAQNQFAFTNEFKTTFVTTMATDAIRKRLERDIREAMSRRNRALSVRADLMMKMGMIR
jgi:hypothetical protein